MWGPWLTHTLLQNLTIETHLLSSASGSLILFLNLISSMARPSAEETSSCPDINSPAACGRTLKSSADSFLFFSNYSRPESERVCFLGFTVFYSCYLLDFYCNRYNKIFTGNCFTTSCSGIKKTTKNRQKVVVSLAQRGKRSRPKKKTLQKHVGARGKATGRGAGERPRPQVQTDQSQPEKRSGEAGAACQWWSS